MGGPNRNIAEIFCLDLNLIEIGLKQLFQSLVSRHDFDHITHTISEMVITILALERMGLDLKIHTYVYLIF